MDRENDIIRGEKLWKVNIGEGKNSFTLYIVSCQKPLLIFESYLGKLRRMFDFSSKVREPQPIFYLPCQENATVEKTDRMHGFKLEQITSHHIILSVENPQEKDLYEILLTDRKKKGFLKKYYLLASSKREAIKNSDRFRSIYQTKIKKAKKMDCYPIISINRKRIVLGKVQKGKKLKLHKILLQSPLSCYLL